jgi:FtsP/CotA-like multicopper oxidase with cupredoxin domain
MARKWSITIFLLLFGLTVHPAEATVFTQVPGDLDGDCVPDPFLPGGPTPNPAFRPNVRGMHLSAGDGFVRMADGTVLYCFGFSDVTGMTTDSVMMAGMLAANCAGPTIALDQGNEFYLNLTNVGMMMRPDLFDPHTVHWHGFPNAAPIFDGMPDGSVGINMGATFTFYYQVVECGTFFYHCHVEATEHMQMGMIGNLYVHAAQDKTTDGVSLGAFTHHTGYRYAYNDGDGSTRYDVEVPMQMTSMDSNFHMLHLGIQPLPFAMMDDDYALLNGRGYPDTTVAGALPGPDENGGLASQQVTALVEAKQGQKVLLRTSNVSVTNFYTLSSPSIPMKVIGSSAKILRGPTGIDTSYLTNSVTLGGGEARDVLLDTAGIAPGTYFLYTTNLNYLSNGTEDFGGMMTEVHIQPAV